MREATQAGIGRLWSWAGHNPGSVSVLSGAHGKPPQAVTVGHKTRLCSLTGYNLVGIR